MPSMASAMANMMSSGSSTTLNSRAVKISYARSPKQTNPVPSSFNKSDDFNSIAPTNRKKSVRILLHMLL